MVRTSHWLTHGGCRHQSINYLQLPFFPPPMPGEAGYFHSLGFSSNLELFLLTGLVKEERRKSLLNNPLHISSQPSIHMILLIQLDDAKSYVMISDFIVT